MSQESLSSVPEHMAESPTEPIKTPADLAKEINCQYVIPDTSKMPSCNYNKGPHKIDWSRNILLVDFSYLTFSRFFAMRTWYMAAHSKVAKHLAKDYDWCSDPVFMEKYTHTYMNKVLTFCKQHKIPRTNIIYALDCRHNDNWRVQSSTGYKGTRAESHEKNDFHNFDIFGYSRKVILAAEQSAHGNLVLSHENLEADDIIALIVKYLESATPTPYPGSVYILANDRDYIQICEKNVYLYDITYKPLSSLLLGTHMSARDFLIRKILLGDVSDNIPGCYISRDFLTRHNIKQPAKSKTSPLDYTSCTAKLIDTLFQSPSAKQELYTMLDECRQYLSSQPDPDYKGCDPVVVTYPHHPATSSIKDNQFLYNARVIDFANIPRTLASEIVSVFTNEVKYSA